MNQVSTILGLMRCRSSHLAGHRPVEHYSEETVGVLGAVFMLQKTCEYLGQARRSAKGGFLRSLGI